MHGQVMTQKHHSSLLLINLRQDQLVNAQRYLTYNQVPCLNQALVRNECGSGQGMGGISVAAGCRVTASPDFKLGKQQLSSRLQCLATGICRTMYLRWVISTEEGKK